MMGGQPLVVADRAAVPAEPGEGPLDDPAAGQDLKGVRQAPTDELDAQAQGGRPGDQPASIAASAQTSRTPRQRARSRLRSQAVAPLAFQRQ
jgi:hypothetical protein